MGGDEGVSFGCHIGGFFAGFGRLVLEGDEQRSARGGMSRLSVTFDGKPVCLPASREKDERKTMSPDTLIKELATELGNVMRTLDEAHLRQNYEEELIDVAARLVLKLKSRNITIAPVTTRAEKIERDCEKAAARIFDIFGGWMQTHPTYCVVIDKDTTGKPGVALRSGMTPLAFFQGETVQDACAQAAQTILFNEGEKDDREQA